ncbi:MAG: aldehyde dehydrogenase family protein [Thermoleophilia bacterium]|nr:aldehyde dehydrogenase family protein [Thermoleophilia bacterium]
MRPPGVTVAWVARRSTDLLRTKAFVAGSWQDTDDGATLPVTNPATGEVLEVGILGISTGLSSTEAASFGGVKESGTGREGSSCGIDDWVELKSWALGRL